MANGMKHDGEMIQKHIENHCFFLGDLKIIASFECLEARRFQSLPAASAGAASGAGPVFFSSINRIVFPIL